MKRCTVICLKLDKISLLLHHHLAAADDIKTGLQLAVRQFAFLDSPSTEVEASILHRGSIALTDVLDARLSEALDLECAHSQHEVGILHCIGLV